MSVASITPEIIEEVYRYLRNVVDAARKAKIDVKRVGSRIRSLPTLYKELGIVATAAFLYGSSKDVSLDRLKKAYELVNGNASVINDLAEKEGKEIDEKTSYSIVLAIYLKIIGERYREVTGKRTTDVKTLLETVLERFGGDVKVEAYLEKVLIKYLIALKKLAEAMLPSERGE